MKLFILLRALRRALWTWINYIRFFRYLKLEKSSRIDSSFRMYPFYKNSGCLKLILREGSHIGSGAIIKGSAPVVFGERSYCGAYCIFAANEHIEIGQDVIIADCVSIRDTDHLFSDSNVLIREQGTVSLPVVIHHNVWIGHGVTILKGVTIGQGSVIAAGAVVTQNIPPFTVAGGIPARIIKEIKGE